MYLRWRSLVGMMAVVAASRPRMKVESAVTVMLVAAAAGLTAGSIAQLLSELEHVAAQLLPTSTGRRCANTPASAP
jgi:hypothetical protein